MLNLSQQLKYLKKNLPGIDKICLYYTPIGKCEDIKLDIINAVFDQVFLYDGSSINNKNDFMTRLDQGRDKTIESANNICQLIGTAVKSLHEIGKTLNSRLPSGWQYALDDIHSQLEQLFYPGFVSETPMEWLRQYPRYMKAIEKRLDKLQHAADRDKKLMEDITPLWQHYLDYINNDGEYTSEIDEYRWMLEELRVSLFAQELKTVRPVSVKRLKNHWHNLEN